MSSKQRFMSLHDVLVQNSPFRQQSDRCTTSQMCTCAKSQETNLLPTSTSIFLPEFPHREARPAHLQVLYYSVLMKGSSGIHRLFIVEIMTANYCHDVWQIPNKFPLTQNFYSHGYSYSSILFYSTLFYYFMFCSILFYSILLYSILFYFVQLYSLLFYSILLCSILFYSIMLYCTLFCYFMFNSILLNSI